MDEEERQRRMQELQMADLGTARREYISTVDLPNKYRHIGLDQIEVIRAANMKGSEVQKIAEINKAQLSAWNNAHQTIGGDVQLEELDGMMSGQSHRAQLCDMIRAKGGQEYIRDPAAPPRGPSRGSHSSRAFNGPGRGGGVAGSRGRGGFSKTPLAPKNTPSPHALGNIGNHPVESPQDRRRYLDNALHPDVDENFPGKHGKFGEIAATSHATKSDRGSRGRGRAGTVKTRRVVDPSANFEAMLAGPSDFMAVAKAHSGPPETMRNAVTQSVTPSNLQKVAKEEVHTQEEASHKEVVLEGGIKGVTETQTNEETRVTVAEERHVKGTVLLEQNIKPTAANPWAIQVVSLPFDCIGTGPTDLGGQKTDKGFRSSLPKPLLASEESTLLVDLMRKSRPTSSLASPVRYQRVGSGNNKEPESTFLDISPPSMQMLLPEVCGNKVENSQDGTSNTAMKGALDLLIDRLQNELDQVNQIIEDCPETTESTGIGAYLLSRKQQLEREIAEAIEMESDIVLPFSALTLEDTSHRQPKGELSVSQEMLTPEAPNNSMDKEEKAPLERYLGSPSVPSGPPNIAPQQASFIYTHTPPNPTATSSTFTSSVCDIIGNHLLPGRYSSSAKSDLETPKVMSGSSSLHDFSTTPDAPVMGEPMSPPHAAVRVDHNSINQLQMRYSPNIPDNATTRQYMQSAPELPQRPVEPWNVHAPLQQNTPFSATTQQYSSSLHHSPEQSDLSSYPIASAAVAAQYPGVPSQSQHAAQISQSLFSTASILSRESSEQTKPVALRVSSNFPMSAATMQYSGALFQRQEENVVSQSPGISTPASQNPPCCWSKSATPTFVPNLSESAVTLQSSGAVFNASIRATASPPPTGQENRNLYTARATRKNSEASISSSNKPPRLSGLQNSKWATLAGAPTSPKAGRKQSAAPPAGAPTSPKGARKQSAAPRPGNGPGGINRFATEMARHGVSVSKRAMDESATNSGPSKRQKESSGLASSKWVS
ncbi:hypothetical protein EMCG_05011 [[Emmonsia] crescens]|uniref:Ataxin-2 C-terminal domain-containing protein n=1 Tax=[Emmonsia] crescens TaxID=73230 RepID=A0A0G2IY44_9EURO|nr:hypothetical protein EMCG_05011 [Emmonsia crescens UAMH 3008]